jgi:hypothetical protein
MLVKVELCLRVCGQFYPLVIYAFGCIKGEEFFWLPDWPLQSEEGLCSLEVTLEKETCRMHAFYFILWLDLSVDSQI